MQIIWLGHSGFRMEIGGLVVLFDPWLSGNPMFPEDRAEEATKGATHIFVTHGHSDHTGDAVAISRDLGIPIHGIYDLMSWWGRHEKVETVGFNKGGTIDLGKVQITMVNAVHSSSLGNGAEGPVYGGAEAGFMIAAEGHVIYLSGDTDVMADMGVFNDLHQPDIGILAAGGYFTMDMARAAYAAQTFFTFRTVIPCHYRTFPLLAQSAAPLAKALPGVDVIEPEVLRPIKI